MPLMKSKSKKAFEHNLKAEMHAGKPQDQSLAIAYSVKRKAKKASGGTVESGSRDMNMAKGGDAGEHSANHAYNYDDMQKMKGINKVLPMRTDKGLTQGTSESNWPGAHSSEQRKTAHKKTLSEMRSMPNPKLKGMAEGGAISAKTEKRPMPDDLHDDAMQAHENMGKKPLTASGWTDRQPERAATKPSHTPLSQPKMVESGVIRTTLRKHEHDLMGMDPPSSPNDQPERDLDEEDAKKMGKGPDMSKPHTTAKAYANGGNVDPDHGANRHNKAVDSEYGGKAEEDMLDEPSGLTEDDDERTLPVDEYMSTNRMSPMLAEGGHIEEDMDNYADDGHEDSIAAAIMARRDRLHAEIDSGAHDMDLAARDEDSSFEDGEPAGRIGYADGGEVDLSINHEEEPNNEDQMSFQALKKENYNSSNLDVENPEDSGQTGDEREKDSENRHDRVSAIMSKMNARKQFKQR